MLQETTTNTYPLSLAGAETGLAGAKPSVVQTSLNEHGEQLAKLTELVDMLRNRLQPVSLSLPRNEVGPDAQSAGRPATSAVAAQLQAQTENVRSLQGYVDTILQELEI